MGFNYEQYESVLVKNKTDFKNLENFSNATGDVADLQSKLSNLETNLNYYRGEESQLQGYYDKFNAMSPCKLCKKDKETKEAGKKEYASKLDIVRNNIKNILNSIATTKIDLTNEINRVYQVEQERLRQESIERARLAAIEQKRLDDAAAKVISDAKTAKEKAEAEAKIAKEKLESDAAIELAKKTAQDLADKEKKALDIKREVDLKLVDKGVVPEAELKKAEGAAQAVVEAAKINAVAQAKVTELTGVSTSKIKNYLMIGGFVVIVVGAIYFLRNKSNN